MKELFHGTYEIELPQVTDAVITSNLPRVDTIL